MDTEQARAYLLTLPHVVETHQWESAVFWVGDKAVGGKMFAMLELDPAFPKVMSYPAGAERYHELLEEDGVVPAPYMARIFWVAVERWGVWRNARWQDELAAAHTLTLAKMPPKVKAVLALPKGELKAAVAAGREKAAAKTAGKKAGRRSHMSLDG